MIYYIIIISIIFFELYLTNYRSELYGIFYSSISEKQINYYIISQYVVVGFLVFLLIYLKDVVKLSYKIKYKKQINCMVSSYNKDLSLIYYKEQEKAAEHFINFFDLLIYGLTSFKFIYNIFVIIEFDWRIFLPLISFFIVSTLFSFYFLTSYTNKLHNIYITKNNAIKRNLIDFFKKNTIYPLNFVFKNFSNNLFEEEKKYYRFYYFKTQFNEFLSNAYLFAPYIIFGPYYLNETIKFGQFMQLINLFIIINYGILKIEQSYLAYNLYKESLKRMKFAINNTKTGDVFQIKKLKLIINKKIIFDDFNFTFSSDKINLIGDHARGKTSLFNTLKGYNAFEGEIILPKNIVFISEKPTVPENYIIDDNLIFIENCKLFDVDPYTVFTNASGAEKWKLIAAYALQFEYIVWDDLFWGVKDKKYIDILIKNSNKILIFSAKKINSKYLSHVYM